MEQKQWPADLKRTKPRELVWRILSEADQPLDVREIYSRLQQLDGTAAVSTVYRVLAAFEERNLVERTTMMGEEMALYSLRHASHAHYAICLKCHKQVPLKKCPFEDLVVQTEGDSFVVTNHRLELYGYCRECQCKT